ncbi:MAG: hypothetical protein IJA55_00700 [Clostridia bacterium]|nr:hypothetical protein [Clostridia bacterium]
MLNFLITLGGISLAMSVVIILMLALRKPIKKRFAALGRYIIWSVIIIRLCLPVSLDILPKLITLPSVMPEEEAVIYEPVTPEVIPEAEYTPEVIPEAEYTPEAVTPVEPSSEVINEPVFDNTENETQTPLTPTVEPVTPKPAFEITGEHIITALFAVWAVGAVTFVTVTLIRYRINAKRLDSTLNIPAPELWSIYDTVCRELNIKKAPPLYMGRADVSPMVYGFFNPKVVLPSAEMSAQSAAYILRHELTHYKRGDLWFKLIAMFANALHWFNPLVYAACSMMSAEAELSCDESALRKTDLMGRLGYGNSMLEIVKLCRHAPKLTTGFSPKKRAVKERFENMINTTKKKKGYWIVAIILICTLLCTSIIGCTTKDTEPKETDEITEPDTEYDDGAICYDMDGERIRDWAVVAKDGVISIGRTTEDHGLDILYSYGESSKHKDVIGISADFKAADMEYRYPAFEAWISDNYSIITYHRLPESVEECANQYIFMIDMSTGEVVHELYYGVDDILELHGLDREVLSVYESWGGKAPEYNVTVRLSNYDIVGEEPTSLVSIGHELENKDIRRANVYTYFDMDTGELSEIEKGHCNLEDFAASDVVSDIADISRIRDIDDNTLKAAEGFLSGDTATLEKLGGYEPGFLDDLKSIKFGDYRISNMVNGKGLQLEAYVTESLAYNVDKGFHTFAIDNTGVSHSCVECLYPEVEYYDTIQTEKMAENWVLFSNSTIVPMGEAYTDEYFTDVVRYLHFIYNANTVDEYRNYAKKCFGIDILTESYTDKEAEDKTAELWDIYCDASYSNKNYVPCYTVDAGEDFITLEFYADHGCLIPAYKVKYEFTKEDEYLYFKSSTVLEDTGREAWGSKPIHDEYIIDSEISD